MNRRRFLQAGVCAAASRAAFAADAEVSLAPVTGAPQISPHIYGHFIEHLGAVIYDGIWVGRNSRVPNAEGIRRDFLDDMKRIGAPNFRWPGGCFADGYHWRDGIGKSRSRTYNYWQGQAPAGVDHTETNEFGVHEFIRLCRLTGAEPYLAANVGGGSPREFHDWVQYCNAPAGTVSLAAERAANGSPEPFAVKWWGVGNESWGCGGDMKPQEYATLYRRFVTQFPAYAPKPYLVAVGPRGHSRDMDLGWTNGFFEAMQGGHRSPVHGLSMHFYTDFRNTKERVATFGTDGWYAVIREGLRTEQVIEAHWSAMAKWDPQHRTKLVVDEWGVWYPPGEETAPAHLLSQPLTLRDALHTAVTFDVFNRHADKIAMANVAQTINCLHSLAMAKGDRYWRTPVWYVFEMYRPHMGADLVPARVKAEALSVSASRKDRKTTVSLTNFSHDTPSTVRIAGVAAREARGRVLTNESMRAREVSVAPLPVTVRADGLEVRLPKHSVAVVEIV